MSLKALIEKQRQAAQAATPATPATGAEGGRKPASDSAASPQGERGGKQVDTPQSTPTAPSVESPAQPQPTAKLRFGAAAKSTAVATIPSVPAVQTPLPPRDNDSLTLDDIAGDDSDYEVKRLDASGFHDEIPCSAPDRDLGDLNDSQKAFVQQLNSIYELMHDPELFGQMIRTIMQEMQEHPDYVKLMVDQDVHTMIRGLRESMGLARVKKAEKSTKTRAGSKKAISAPQMAGTLDEMFNSEDW